MNPGPQREHPPPAFHWFAVLGPNIFVIDDDRSVRRALSRLVRAAGMEVQTFAGAEEYVETAQTDPDCLVVDVCMPGMGGLQLQQWLSARGRLVPIVFITSHEDEFARRAALAGGAIAFLQKPFDETALLDAIASALATSGRSNWESHEHP